jgi:hypothetical protein
MTRSFRIALAALLLMLANAAPSSRLDAQEAPPTPLASAPPPTPAGPATAGPGGRDPLDEFVPHEKVEADSVVAFPVDL